MTSKIRVAVVGAGTISELHLRAYAKMTDSVEVVALVDKDPARREAVARRHSLPALADHRAVVERPDVDLIDVCTPPAAHAGIVIDGLDAEKLVVCEKPLAPTLEGLDSIQGAAKKRSGRLSTVHQYRVIPEIRRMVRLRDAGELGDLLFGQFIQYDRLVGGPIAATSWWGDWGTSGGGVAMTQFLHHLDLMCLLFGTPVEVTALMGTLGSPIESEDVFSATVRFEGGALVAGTSTMTAQETGFRIDIFGRRGSAHYPWTLHTENRRRGLGAKATSTFELLRAWVRASPLTGGVRRARRLLGLGGVVETKHDVFLRELIHSAKAGEPLPVPPEEARRPVELCIAGYTSALLKEAVRLPVSADSPFYRGISSAAYREATELRDPMPAAGKEVAR